MSHMTVSICVYIIHYRHNLSIIDTVFTYVYTQCIHIDCVYNEMKIYNVSIHMYCVCMDAVMSDMIINI